MDRNPVNVVCVDDNEWIGESIRRVLSRSEHMSWGGWFSSCHDFLEQCEFMPGIVVLDLDIPGEDAFESVASISSRWPDSRVLILSGYLGAELVDRALDAGAWGYISKNETSSAVLESIKRVEAGEVALSPAVIEEYQRH